jgi:hypothetical protein
MSEPTQPTGAELRRAAALEQAKENSALTNALRERDEARGALALARKDRDNYADELQQEEGRVSELRETLVRIRNITDEAIRHAIQGSALEEIVLKVFGIAHEASKERKADDELQS